MDNEEKYLREKFKNPPGVGSSKKVLREEKRRWKKELHKFQRRKGKDDLKDYRV